jgi:hypothetical protein
MPWLRDAHCAHLAAARLLSKKANTEQFFFMKMASLLCLPILSQS